MEPKQMPYERILDDVSGLPRAQSPNDRTISWLDESNSIGVARSPERRIEIFLVGPELRSRSRVLQDSLEYQTWHREAGSEPLLANRLLLPGAGHFDQVAAFLCTELLRNGVAADVQAAFDRTEPVLELAIQRLRIADRAVLGLVGELLVLEALLREAGELDVSELLAAWNGYRASPRDIALGHVGVEVKTTARTTSTHEVQGVHQVEPTPSEELPQESALLLVSIGLQWLDEADVEGEARTLPRLVDSIIERICAGTEQAEGEAGVAKFLGCVEEYGAASEIGYDHKAMSTHAAFKRPYAVRFVRCYNMSHPNIWGQVLRSDDVRSRPYTDLASVRFRIDLPEVVEGDVHPLIGLTATAHEILRLGVGAT